MNVRRGDIVLVDFPYSDHTGSKVRPALVGQADVWNQRLDDTILALITSSRRRRLGAAIQCGQTHCQCLHQADQPQA